MKLKTLYVRFFRSLNIDYLRKYADTSNPSPWDQVGTQGQFYPFVRLDLEADITTIVGANEAGKTQILTAIKCLLGAESYVEEDFCRYSGWFAEDNGPRLPEFGGEFFDLTESERETLRQATDSDFDSESFHFFRFHDRTAIYLEDREITSFDEGALSLPRVFEINAKVPLPDSVEISYLAAKSPSVSRTRRSWLERMLFVRSNPSVLREPVAGAVRPQFQGSDEVPDASTLEQWALAKRLLIEVAGVAPHDFEQLASAVQTSDAYAEALVAKINRKLSDALNFRKWWTQDSEFSLLVKLRDFDLVFTVRDRTGTDYTFRERSQGLKYFLSYFVQYLSHGGARDEELLLMDEPDAFLSNSGQQDLLRIFDAFAYPESGREPVQVVYVTHSPFLIDKNHAERVRVLEKGDGEEGTRVVRNAGRNHFEPLRTALGGFVAETTFIGSCNLLLEGQADPILLAGASAVGRTVSPSGHALNLNSLTLVPCGGAQNVPYMAFLARGRDEDKPAIIVLTDNDSEGLAAARKLKSNASLISPVLVFSVSDALPPGTRQVLELEDLVPVALANAAALRVAHQAFASDEYAAFSENWENVTAGRGKKIFKALQDRATAVSDSAGLSRGLELSKVAFARAVVDIALKDAPEGELAQGLYASFAPLMELINIKQREANRLQSGEKISKIIKRLRKGFINDHPGQIRKTDVTALLENIELQLPGDELSDEVLDRLRAIRRDFQLSDEPRSFVADPAGLREELLRVSYARTQAVQTE